MTLAPIRVTKKQACELLAIGREKLRLLTENDPTFPKPYKAGSNMQSPVYFDYQALIDWHKSQGEC
ncbi:helix-turn-helix transcriptional regulator [Moraxella marmotae]|uniref:helix-turn-helix transcriptional regulator n=1 Tax=Moraxella marmotae TaxID=3344520 RepID=UPI0035F2A51E